ncbi:ATP-dependent RNA helicase CshB [Bacillus pakistanensis]|uniref:DEAD-box ATP-dependent RNA helicase CshB n=1 Tax=Rossellomorea pakistanensis TaxID=992288 RepID=A0ABS2NA15_9BACI|nr:DEAD/DEAH box helicase [Bacillus pakistanensis]MBM7584702.1 ATP-dependent RNA helicase CshB [Bacillus pakistanensis]
MAIQFNQFQFKPFVNKAIENLGFLEPTEIQKKMIPLILKNKSAIGQSQTGTGKTHSYLLPILDRVDPNSNQVQAVITAPTRELAQQIYGEVLKIAKESDDEITARCFIGGTDKQRTIEKLKVQPQVVIGTPGRINDLVNEQALFVHTAITLVVDEADLMLDMGFIQDVDQIAGRMPEELQMLVFSATIPEKLKPFLKKYMENPQYAHVEPEQISAKNIHHYIVPTKSRKKIDLLHDMLVSLNPYLGIVFTNTKAKADEVADALLEKGLKVGRLHGGLTPRDRKRVMKQIRDLEFQYIVATDLAARGIDIEGVSHIINYEIPSDLDFYVHRTGRTARAGSSGVAITIYEAADEDSLNQLEKMGIVFEHKDLQKGDWIDLHERHKRKNRQKTDNEIDKKAKSLVRKPKKVKPGYKRKMKWEMDKIKKRERRIQNKRK